MVMFRQIQLVTSGLNYGNGSASSSVPHHHLEEKLLGKIDQILDATDILRNKKK